MTEPSRAVFLSYASEDATAAQRIAEALRSAGIEVWFDREELRGGDAWDQKIRQQIRDCRLFVPIISAHSEARLEGYFRREWKLAVDRTDDMASEVTFLVPVVIDDTPNASAHVPERFRHVQWTRLPSGLASPDFTQRVRHLLSPERSPALVPTGRAAIPALSAAPTSQKFVYTRSRSRAALVATVVGLAVLAVGYLAWDRLSRPGAEKPIAASSVQPEATNARKNTIAVLPFADLSERRDQAYFAEGMAEQLAGLLGKIPSVRVIGTTSSFRFKDKSVDTRSIAEQLGASYLVQGNVRRSGDRIRVAAQLLEGQSGEQLWADGYDRSVSDAIRVQDEIATSLARALQLTVSADLEMHQSVKSPEVYDLYLKGLHAADLGTREGAEEAIADFQQALSLDPAYVPAAVELASEFLDMGLQDWAPNREALERARKAAQQALRLDPKLGTAHAAMSRVHLYSRDWHDAQTEVLEAQKLGAQRDWRTAETAAALAANAGQWTQAIQLDKAAMATDPLNADLYAALAEMVYIRCGRLAEAETALRRTLEITPPFGSAHYYLGIVLMLQGRLDEALREVQQETVEDGRFEGSALVYHAMGRKAESDLALKRAIEQHQEDWGSGIARVYAYRGELDQAMKWLERAYTVGDLDLFVIKSDPLLKKLEDEPRYKTFLRKINLLE